jgi:hypothetical protein
VKFICFFRHEANGKEHDHALNKKFKGQAEDKNSFAAQISSEMLTLKKRS